MTCLTIKLRGFCSRLDGTIFRVEMTFCAKYRLVLGAKYRLDGTIFCLNFPTQFHGLRENQRAFELQPAFLARLSPKFSSKLGLSNKNRSSKSLCGQIRACGKRSSFDIQIHQGLIGDARFQFSIILAQVSRSDIKPYHIVLLYN